MVMAKTQDGGVPHHGQDVVDPCVREDWEILGQIEDREEEIYLSEQEIQELMDKRPEGYQEQATLLQKEVESYKRDIKKLKEELYGTTPAGSTMSTQRKLKILWGIAVILMVLQLLNPPRQWTDLAVFGGTPPDWTAAFARCIAIALVAGFLTWLMKGKTPQR
ncbi:MAG: hypothetical protein A3B65_06015 [Acidobacteria bacterium RIFCSPHIGHO2_02_FULL_67_57]|nr:MAG: hypothetical protein A3B65_06015 [Acidobacteria bacterium RIFCSPHIGHO2_02_FULL_67_57]